MRYLVYIPTVAFMIGLVIGCGSEKSSTAATPKKNNNNVCAKKQVYTAQYGCLAVNTNYCDKDEGWHQPTNQCVPRTTPPKNGSGGVVGQHMWAGSFYISDRGLYRDFLKDMGVCDRTVWGWDFGYASCDAWDGNGELVMYLNKNKLPSPGSFLIYVQGDVWTTGGQMVPLQFQGEWRPINKDAGFEIRTTGYAGSASYNDIIRVVAEDQTIEDGQIRVSVRYRRVGFPDEEYTDREIGYSIVRYQK